MYIKNLTIIVIQVIALILFGTCVAFPDATDLIAVADSSFLTNEITTYGLFQQVHVMIFVGFGFLMVFLKTYSWTAVGYNYLIATFIIPMAILFTGFWHQAFAGKWHMIELSMSTIINADFAAAVHLITFGVLLGRVSLPQLFVIASIETFIWAFNEALILTQLKATDIGGSIVIHMFGAYFGLAASFFVQSKRSNNHPNNASSYTSNLVAFVGTIFLFMYWPSFNSALSEGASQQRAIINTYLAISSSTLSACVMSRVVHNKLDIEIVLNATLAGGVAIGSSADLITMPVISILIGMIAGNVSALGFSHIGPFLNQKIGLVDVCGVHNLHGIPAWISCIASIFVTAGLNKDKFDLIPERVAESQFVIENLDDYPWTQLVSGIITFIVAIVGGSLAGWVSSFEIFAPSQQLFLDTEHWEQQYDSELKQIEKNIELQIQQ